MLRIYQYILCDLLADHNLLVEHMLFLSKCKRTLILIIFLYPIGIIADDMSRLRWYFLLPLYLKKKKQKQKSWLKLTKRPMTRVCI